MRHLDAALAAGVNAVMFSDQFAGGATRMVREATKGLANPPAIYAHNSGISTRTRSLWREVLDFLVRLDGGDFRQTAPLTTTAPLLRPNGLEWLRCEEALSRPAGPGSRIRRHAGGRGSLHRGARLRRQPPDARGGALRLHGRARQEGAGNGAAAAVPDSVTSDQ